MAIANAVERGRWIHVYDEKGKQLFTRPIGSGPKDGLQGYTASTVNIRQGNWIITYDENGRQMRSTSTN